MRTPEVLDFLYCLACENDVPEDQMRLLCTLLGVHWDDLCKHSIKVATSS